VTGNCVSLTARSDTSFPDNFRKEASKKANTNSMNVSFAESSTDSLAIIRMTGNPANEIVPLLPGISLPPFFVPSISWDFNVEININNGSPSSWKVVGNGGNNRAHDAFPAYELTIKGKSIHEHEPIPNNDPLDLANPFTKIILNLGGSL
jgi:hypothetical protein